MRAMLRARHTKQLNGNIVISLFILLVVKTQFTKKTSSVVTPIHGSTLLVVKKEKEGKRGIQSPTVRTCVGYYACKGPPQCSLVGCPCPVLLDPRTLGPGAQPVGRSVRGGGRSGDVGERKSVGAHCQGGARRGDGGWVEGPVVAVHEMLSVEGLESRQDFPGPAAAVPRGTPAVPFDPPQVSDRTGVSGPCCWPSSKATQRAQGCIGREGTSEASPEAVRQAVEEGCQSGWGPLLSVTNAIEAGTRCQGGSGWS